VIDRQKQLRKAMNIYKTLGPWVAARYMARRGWSIEAALYVLIGRVR